MKFFDTNALLNIDLINEDKFLISSVTLEELESIKTNKNKTDELRYQARKVTRWLSENEDKYEVIIYTEELANTLNNSSIAIDTSDAKICVSAGSVKDKDIVFITNDLCCKNIASKIFGLNVATLDEAKQEIYKGYKIIKGDSSYITSILANPINWNINEYAIIQNTDDCTEKEMRFDGEKFVPLKLPSSKFIKAKNALQRCALDALMNPDITIVAILGTYGSGKTYLAMQMALHAIREYGSQSKILGVREIIGEGKEPGYLPGDLESKVGAFFEPLTHSLQGGYFELESLKQAGILETAIPHFMKGTTYNETVVICDEAEDLKKTQLRLIGTRLGENSRIFFSGDFKQSLIDKSQNNALIEMCNVFKGQKNFACICLETDVRSETSRMFAELFTD